MVRNPPGTQTTDSTANRMVHELASLEFDAPQAEARVEIGRAGRELCVYSGKLGYDLQYLVNWSPVLDLEIIARTIWVVLARRV